MRGLIIFWIAGILALGSAPLHAEGEWEITRESEQAVERGLDWLARNQGERGNWESNDLGLVSMGALAFLSAGHLPDRGRYGDNVRRALDYVVANAKPSGLLNISNQDMYNHGLSVFVLTQAYGMTFDRRLGEALDRGVKLIIDVQAEDGGWDYKAVKLQRGHDLSLAVMQAKALRGATDIGLEIPSSVIDQAIQSVRKHYKPTGTPDGKRYGDHPMADRPGAFTYDGNRVTTAMAACGAVCLQEFGQYTDFRIHRSMDEVIKDIRNPNELKVRNGYIPFDAYTMYYVAQGLYQVGGERWKDNYPLIREAIVKTQNGTTKTDQAGSWNTNRVGGKPGQLFGTAVAVFTLSIPNRYLPILQEGQTDPRNADTDRPPAR
ncbi:MAG: hypothetical protein WD768_22865 [Phycisphaeraceae bacterium]